LFIVNGVIDYNHNGVYAYVSIVKRISSDDNKYELYKAPKGKTSSPIPFDKQEELQLVANYFRKYL